MGAADPRCQHAREACLMVGSPVGAGTRAASIGSATLAGTMALLVLTAVTSVTALVGLVHAQAPATGPGSEADLIDQGRDLYGDMCATCHGRDMVNAGGIAFDLRKFPKDDFARFRASVLNGKNQAMPAWRETLSEEDVAALWAYVRSGG
jgi:mono/diheme cytochrome c family protein